MQLIDKAYAYFRGFAIAVVDDTLAVGDIFFPANFGMNSVGEFPVEGGADGEGEGAVVFELEIVFKFEVAGGAEALEVSSDIKVGKDLKGFIFKIMPN